LQLLDLPSPAMVTVTFSHHGAVELSIGSALAAAVAGAWAFGVVAAMAGKEAAAASATAGRLRIT
jgi:hypothetical protein